jgi:hypothetical protein
MTLAARSPPAPVLLIRKSRKTGAQLVAKRVAGAIDDVKLEKRPVVVARIGIEQLLATAQYGGHQRVGRWIVDAALLHRSQYR